MMCLVAWANEFADTIDDAPSLRTVRGMALRDIARWQRIYGSIRDREIRREWATELGDELIDNHLVVRQCEAGLARLGAGL